MSKFLSFLGFALLGFILLILLPVGIYVWQDANGTIGLPDFILEWMVSTRVTVCVSVLIVCIGCWVWCRFYLDTRRLLKKLVHAADKVRSSQWDELSEVFEKMGQPYKRLFDRFAASASNDLDRFSLNTSGKERLYALLPPEEVFTEDVLYEGQVNVPAYHSTPGVLTGLGIFFTFVGLAGGVGLATSGLMGNQSEVVSSTDITGLLQSIGSLLDGAGQAFATSIAGLAASIFFSYLMHKREQQIFKAIENLQAAFSEVAPTLDFQTTLLFLAKRNEMLEQTVSGIKSGADHWVDLLVEKFTQGFSQVTREQTESLKSSLDALNQSLSQSLSDLKAKEEHRDNARTQEVLKNISGVLNTAMGRMKESLDETAVNLDKTVSSLDKTIGGMSENMDLAFANARQTLAQMVDSARDAGKGLEQSTVDMKGAVNTLSEGLRNGGERITELVESCCMRVEDSAGKVSQRFVRTAEEFGEKVQGSGEQFAESVSEVAEKIVQTAEGLGEKVKESGDQLSASVSAISEKIVQTADSFGDKVNDSGAQYSQSLFQVSEKIAKTAAEFGERIQDSQNRFAESLSEISETFTRAADGFGEKIKNSGDQFSESLSDASGKFNTEIHAGAEGFAASIEASAGTFAKNIEDSFSKPSEELSACMNKAVDCAKTVGDSIEQIADSQKSIEKSFAEIIDSLNTASSSMKLLVQDYNASAEKIAAKGEAMGRLVQGGQEQVDEVNKTCGIAIDQVRKQLQQALTAQVTFQQTTETLQSLLGEGVEQFAEFTSKLNNVTNDTIRAFDSQVSQAVGSLTQGLEKWMKFMTLSDKNLHNSVSELETLVKNLHAAAVKVGNAAGGRQ